jgi:hypothetical protein
MMINFGWVCHIFFHGFELLLLDSFRLYFLPDLSQFALLKCKKTGSNDDLPTCFLAYQCHLM